ncbi:hypothetical protein [Loigolactobacillus binensis]|uniref:Uncharacterized protein n=1 Tax=Loigolactobacillus binensis TaxID=2559922 RepID=A0ABW3EGD9_9LACO|nr:hypothetical protein [Loigolactobacillus binensis]
MEKNYWHKMVVLTGLTLIPSTISLTHAIKRLHSYDGLHKRNIAFLLAAGAAVTDISISHAISIHEDLKQR